LHAARSVDGVCNEFIRVGAELSVVAALEQLRVAGDHAEGFLEIVAGDVGELLEFAVAAL